MLVLAIAVVAGLTTSVASFWFVLATCTFIVLSFGTIARRKHHKLEEARTQFIDMFFRQCTNQVQQTKSGVRLPIRLSIFVPTYSFGAPCLERQTRCNFTPLDGDYILRVPRFDGLIARAYQTHKTHFLNLRNADKRSDHWGVARPGTDHVVAIFAFPIRDKSDNTVAAVLVIDALSEQAANALETLSTSSDPSAQRFFKAFEEAAQHYY